VEVQSVRFFIKVLTGSIIARCINIIMANRGKNY
jgi:hypothetical protein